MVTEVLGLYPIRPTMYPGYKEKERMKVLGMVLFFVGMASFLSATTVPEIDPGSAGSAVALLSGALLIFKASRQR